MARLKFRRRITSAHKFFKLKRISLVNQKIQMQLTYGEILKANYIKNSTLICILDIQPSSESQRYRVKITYKLSDGSPKAWLLSPELQTYDGKYPHHIYGKGENGKFQLCVFYPRYKEWTGKMYVAKAFVPWVCTWLNTYEYWLVSGEWHYDEMFSKQSQKKWRKSRS